MILILTYSVPLYCKFMSFSSKLLSILHAIFSDISNGYFLNITMEVRHGEGNSKDKRVKMSYSVQKKARRI